MRGCYGPTTRTAAPSRAATSSSSPSSSLPSPSPSSSFCYTDPPPDGPGLGPGGRQEHSVPPARGKHQARESSAPRGVGGGAGGAHPNTPRRMASHVSGRDWTISVWTGARAERRRSCSAWDSEGAGRAEGTGPSRRTLQKADTKPFSGNTLTAPTRPVARRTAPQAGTVAPGKPQYRDGSGQPPELETMQTWSPGAGKTRSKNPPTPGHTWPNPCNGKEKDLQRRRRKALSRRTLPGGETARRRSAPACGRHGPRPASQAWGTGLSPGVTARKAVALLAWSSNSGPWGACGLSLSP